MPTPSTRRQRIPRPPNAWMFFRAEHQQRAMDEIRATNQQPTAAAVSKLLGREWQQIPNTDKFPYFKKAQDAAELHRERYPEYKFSPRSKAQKAAEKQQKKAEKQQMKKATSRQTRSTGRRSEPQPWTSYAIACLQAQGLAPRPFWSSAPLEPHSQPQTLSSLTAPPAASTSSSPESTIVPLTPGLEAGPLPNSAPDSQADLDSEYTAAEGDHYVPSAWKMPVNPQATVPHPPPDEDLLKQIDEFFSSCSATSSEVLGPVPVRDDSTVEMDLSGSLCSELSVCVSPSDLILLQESSCSPAPQRIVKRSTTKDRLGGRYTPRPKGKGSRTRASKSPSPQTHDTMVANADDLKSSSSASLDLMEPSSSAYGSVSDWDWVVGLSTNDVPDNYDTSWSDVPLAELWKNIPDLSSSTDFDTSIQQDPLPPPSEPWSDKIWDAYFQFDATV